MAGYNKNFELGIDDLERIETALRTQKKAQSLERLQVLSSAGEVDVKARAEQINDELAAIQDLLGRLHNQKIFYRPTGAKKAPYVSG